MPAQCATCSSLLAPGHIIWTLDFFKLNLLQQASCADRAFRADQTTARLLINGEFKESQSDTWIDVTNPVSFCVQLGPAVLQPILSTPK